MMQMFWLILYVGAHPGRDAMSTRWLVCFMLVPVSAACRVLEWYRTVAATGKWHRRHLLQAHSAASLYQPATAMGKMSLRK